LALARPSCNFYFRPIRNAAPQPLLDRLPGTYGPQRFVSPQFPRGVLEGGAVDARPLLA